MSFEAHVIYGVTIQDEFWQRLNELDLSTVPKDWVLNHVDLEEGEELSHDTLVDILIQDVFEEIETPRGDDLVYFGIEIGALEDECRYSEIPQVTEEQINMVMGCWNDLPSFIQTLMGDIEFDVRIVG